MISAEKVNIFFNINYCHQNALTLQSSNKSISKYLDRTGWIIDAIAEVEEYFRNYGELTDIKPIYVSFPAFDQ